MIGVRTWIGDEGLKTLACHQEGELSIIRDIVLDFQPELMIELGTLIGGVTLLLHQCFPDIPLHSFDNRSMAGCLKKAKGGFTAEKWASVLPVFGDGQAELGQHFFHILPDPSAVVL